MPSFSTALHSVQLNLQEGQELIRIKKKMQKNSYRKSLCCEIQNSFNNLKMGHISCIDSDPASALCLKFCHSSQWEQTFNPLLEWILSKSGKKQNLTSTGSTQYFYRGRNGLI